MLTRNPQQLLLVRQFYEDSCLLTNRQDDLSLMKAVLALDHAVEQMLNTIIMDATVRNSPKGRAGRRDIGWGERWDRALTVTKTLGHELINHDQLLSLHEVRNLAQHNGSVPSQAEVKRYIEPVEAMLQNAFNDIYDLAFNTFRLWDLIKSDDLRQLLIDSESAFEKGHAGVCIIGCTQAHVLIIKAVRDHTKWRRANISRLFSSNMNSNPASPYVSYDVNMKIQQAARQLDNEIRKGVSQFRREIMNEIEFLEDEMVTIGIGMPLMDTRRFQRIGNRLITPVGDSRFSTFAVAEINRNDEVIREEAQFMLAYLSRLTRLISDAYTEVITAIKVERPLTSQHWWKIVDPEVPVATSEGAIISLKSKKTN